MSDAPSESSSAKPASLFSRLFRRGAPTVEESDIVSQPDMRLRVSEFEKGRVGDVMVARAEMASVEIGTSATRLHEIFLEHGHSRLPIYEETQDNPLGFVHIKDFLAILPPLSVSGEARQALRSVQDIIRPVLFVPESMRLPDLLVKMQSTRIHIALVIDEYGGTDGMVTLEDLVEQIVGDIEDEHDQNEALITPCSRSVLEADARAGITELEQALSLSLALPDYEDDIDTVGGLVFALAGRVPERGEIVSHPAGIDLEVVDADPRRIKRLRVRRNEAQT